MSDPSAPKQRYLLSWPRLAALAALAGIIGIAMLSGHSSTNSSESSTPTISVAPAPVEPTAAPAVTQDQAAPPISTTTPAPAGSGDPAPLSTTTAAPLPAEQDWRPIVEGFAADFTRPGPDWADRMNQWVTPDLEAGYRHTDISRLDSDTLTGIDAGTNVTAAAVDTQATYRSGLQLAIRLVPTSAGWRVGMVLPLTTGGG